MPKMLIYENDEEVTPVRQDRSLNKPPHFIDVFLFSHKMSEMSATSNFSESHHRTKCKRSDFFSVMSHL